MKKHSIGSRSSKTNQKRQKVTIGMDLGDKLSRYCVLDEDGQILRESSVGTTKKALTQVFAQLGRCRVALEVGTHSPWVSRLLQGFGHEVIVANPRQLKIISGSSRKDDRIDAQTLARLARVDPQLLRPIRHRSERAQEHLMVIRVRAALVEARTRLVNTARGLAKAIGERLPDCDADSMGVGRLTSLATEVKEPLRPLLEAVGSLTEKIHGLDETIEAATVREWSPSTPRYHQVMARAAPALPGCWAHAHHGEHARRHQSNRGRSQR
jgi:transposase